MKFWRFIKRSGILFCTVAGAVFFIPYLAPLVLLGSFIERDLTFWLIRGVFALAAALFLTFTASLLTRKALRIPLIALLWIALELLVLFEAFMFCFTGDSFNQEFLMNFNFDALSGEVIEVFWKQTVAVLGGFTLIGVGIILLSLTVSAKVEKYKALFIPLKCLLAAGAVALFFLPETPLSILIEVMKENLDSSRDMAYFDALAKDPNAVTPDKIEATAGKNLVFVIVESLEQNYLSKEHFPGLLPEIEKNMKRDDALVFNNMRSAAGNTFAFLYQTHIGDYMYSVFSSSYADRQPSLSQILHKAGYNTSFLKACTLDFASTGDFVKNVKYDRRMDWQHPEVNAQATEIGAWGFRDYELFEIAKNEYDKLASQGKPFCFTLFTVDSHAPDGVIGNRSMVYSEGPHAKRFPLLNALHTTDAALGKFLDHIANTPTGKDTVVVVSGDHLVMRNIVPSPETVQTILEHKPRKNLLTFILNGLDKGVVDQECWPVDLAPVILRQLGVKHNYTFPAGVDIFTVKNAPPREKMSSIEYMAKINPDSGKINRRKEVLARTVKAAGTPENAVIKVGSSKVKLDVMPKESGYGVEFDAAMGMPTAWRFKSDWELCRFFTGISSNRNLFYIVMSNPGGFLQSIMSPRNLDKYMLAVILNGWYKFSAEKEFTDLKVKDIDEEQPLASEAEVDCGHNIIRLKGNHWRFPLFSKNGAYFAPCMIAAVKDTDGSELILRLLQKSENAMKKLRKLLETESDITVIAPPDSFLHRELHIRKSERHHVLRMARKGGVTKIELHQPYALGEGYIEMLGGGNYVYKMHGVPSVMHKLSGEAVKASFSDGWCHVLQTDISGRTVLYERSFKHIAPALEFFKEFAPDRNTLLICSKGSTFLKSFYPNLADKTVIFQISGGRIRHSVQFSNGNFRVPMLWDAVSNQGVASARLANGMFIVRWADASFAMTEEMFNRLMNDGHDLVMKIPHSQPALFSFMTVNNEQWLHDISKADNADYLVFSGEKSRFFGIINQPVKDKYFMGVNVDGEWELRWNSKAEF